MIDRADLQCMDPQGVVDDPQLLHLSVTGRMIAKHCARILEAHYSGWQWGITVDERGGVVHLFALVLSGDMGYTLLLDDVYNCGNFDSQMILMAGGEVLERFGVPRGRFSLDAWRQVRRGPNGIPVPDVTDKNRGLINQMMRRRGLYREPESAIGKAIAASMPRGIDSAKA